jgi:primosomal replication protein N
MRLPVSSYVSGNELPSVPREVTPMAKVAVPGFLARKVVNQKTSTLSVTPQSLRQESFA